MALEQAIHDLESAAEDTSTAQANPRAWGSLVRERLQRVRAVMAEPPGARDGWLAARAQHVDRDRRALLERISALTGRMSETRSASTTLPDVRRLTRDLTHYRKRIYDLQYDAVELELGGFD